MKGIKPNLSKIARQYSCDPRTVKRYLIAGPSACIRAVREYHSILEAYEPTILEKLEFGASAKAIHIFLRSKGFKGGYSTVKNFCRKHKLANKQQATIRFETNPGLQAQVDWKESLRLQNNKGVIFEVNIFLVVLGYSRYKFIKLTTDRTQPTVLKGLLECFQYFGGVPKEILFDNMRTIVDRSRTQFGKPIYNERLYEFSKDSGFIPKSCLAYKPQTKGKVESLANLMNRLKVYNNEFETLDDLNQIVKQVNEDINNEISQATAKSPSELFKSEQKYLNPLPNQDIFNEYLDLKPNKRKVTMDSMISIEGKKYSVPPQYINTNVFYQIKNNVIEILDEHYVLICTHNKSERMINYHYQDQHYRAIASVALRKSPDVIERVCEANLAMYDSI
jgi:transposase